MQDRPAPAIYPRAGERRRIGNAADMAALMDAVCNGGYSTRVPASLAPAVRRWAMRAVQYRGIDAGSWIEVDGLVARVVVKRHGNAPMGCTCAHDVTHSLATLGCIRIGCLCIAPIQERHDERPSNAVRHAIAARKRFDARPAAMRPGDGHDTPRSIRSGRSQVAPGRVVSSPVGRGLVSSEGVA